jgi:Flp pilus assembly protein CpaB
VRKIIFTLIALVAGIGLGLLIGWYAWPVTYTESAPTRMRQDWKDEAVWLAAQAFAYDRDLEAAQARLRPLGTDDLGQLVLDRAEKAIAQNLSKQQIAHLARLAAALGTRSKVTDPYLSP